MTPAELVTYLRAIADFYEAHPDITTLPMSLTWIGDGLSVYCNKEELTKIGSFEKRFVNDRMIAFVPLVEATNTWSDKNHTIGLEFSIPRAQVCTKRVVGTKIVPERYVKGTEGYLEPEHEEEIVEWDCNEPILATEGGNRIDTLTDNVVEFLEKKNG